MQNIYKIRVTNRKGDFLINESIKAFSYTEAMNELREIYPTDLFTLLDINTQELFEKCQ